jgi:four helix bundle protein
MEFMKVENFQDLRTWQEARKLIKEVYQVTSIFPLEEKYRLVAQMRAAAVSVAANIAEGMGRQTTNDLCRFLIIARGSVHEMVSHLLISEDQGFITTEKAKELIERYWGLNAGINSHLASLRF